jgi:hypothetical protein
MLSPYVFLTGNIPKGRLARSMQSTGAAKSEPQFICGVRAAALEPACLYEKVVSRLFQYRLTTDKTRTNK